MLMTGMEKAAVEDGQNCIAVVIGCLQQQQSSAVFLQGDKKAALVLK
jgi:hypothetical protein